MSPLAIGCNRSMKAGLGLSCLVSYVLTPG